MKIIVTALGIMAILAVAEQIGELIQHRRQMKAAESLKTDPRELFDDNEMFVSLMQNRAINEIIVDAMKKTA